MLTRDEIVRAVNLANHEAGFLRYLDNIVLELLERLRRGESFAAWGAEFDEDDVQMALDLRRMESF